jgi:hypothetical protein
MSEDNRPTTPQDTADSHAKPATATVWGSYVAATSAVMGAMHQAAWQWQMQAIEAWLKQSNAMVAATLDAQRQFLNMNPWFGATRKALDAEFAQWEMPSGGAMAYDNAKEILVQQMAFLPAPLRTWCKYQLMHNPLWQKQLRSEGIISALKNTSMMLPGQSQLITEGLNHQFLVEQEDGTLRAVRAEEIDALFPRRKDDASSPDLFPNIVLTSSHARAELPGDITNIIHGIEAMAAHTHKAPLQKAQVDARGIRAGTGDTLILSACDTEKDPVMNAAVLLERMNDLKRIEKTGEADDFAHASAGAKRMAKLILRCMAQNPEDVPLDDLRPLSQTRRAPLVLRPRAELVAQHFQLLGYSKGGNVVSDAMRVLVSELSAKDASGAPLIQFPEVLENRVEDTPENQLLMVRHLVRRIACTSIAALEVPMADAYREAGVRRVSFNNTHDLISNHMHFEGRPDDEKWTIEGSKAKYGHDPEEALGKRDANNPLDYTRGYVLDDVRVMRRLKERFAPLYGKAAIADIAPARDEHMREFVLITTEPGTPDTRLMQHKEKILRALALSGLPNAELHDMGEFSGEFALYLPDIEPIAASNREAFAADVKEKLLAAFKTLRGSQTANLVIGQEVISKLGGPEIGAHDREDVRRSA